MAAKKERKKERNFLLEEGSYMEKGGWLEEDGEDDCGGAVCCVS